MYVCLHSVSFHSLYLLKLFNFRLTIIYAQTFKWYIVQGSGLFHILLSRSPRIFPDVSALGLAPNIVLEHSQGGKPQWVQLPRDTAWTKIPNIKTRWNQENRNQSNKTPLRFLCWETLGLDLLIRFSINQNGFAAWSRKSSVSVRKAENALQGKPQV